MSRMLRVAAAAALVAVGPLVGTLASPAAAADNLGTITVSPTSGTVQDPLELTTSRGCPAGATMSKSRIVGPGFPKIGQNMSGLALGFTSATKPFKVTTEYTIKDIGALAYPPVTFAGAYRLEIVCWDPTKGEVGAFATTITFTNPFEWTATAPTVPVKVGPTAATAPPASKPGSSSKPGTTGSSAKPGASTTPAPGSTDASATDSATDPNLDNTATANAVAAEPASSSSSSLLPLVGGVALGAVAVGGGMTLLQRRQAATPGGRREKH
jgi:hypothetical protein